MTVLSPLVGRGLVELRPAPSYASRDMRVVVTAHGLAQTPAPSNWADALLAEVDQLDESAQQRLLRVVTTRISELQRQGRIPGDADVRVVSVLRRLPPPRQCDTASLLVRRCPVRVPGAAAALPGPRTGGSYQ